MKTELRVGEHHGSEATLFEVWYGDVFIAAIYGADGPGVRIVSKYLSARSIVIELDEPPVLAVGFEPLVGG